MGIEKVKAPGGHWFDDVERATAASRLSRNGRTPVDVQVPVLFVVRMPAPSPLFAWEVRKFAAIVLARGEGYSTEALARAAGGRALIAFTAAAEARE